MSKSNLLENDSLKLFFNSDPLPWDAAADLFVSLHTADPGEGGNQTTNEASFGSYARAEVERSATGWTVAGNQATNAAPIAFPTCTSGTSAVTHFGIGTALNGTGRLLYSGAFNTTANISTGVTLSIPAGQLTISED